MGWASWAEACPRHAVLSRGAGVHGPGQGRGGDEERQARGDMERGDVGRGGDEERQASDKMGFHVETRVDQAREAGKRQEAGNVWCTAEGSSPGVQGISMGRFRYVYRKVYRKDGQRWEIRHRELGQVYKGVTDQPSLSELAAVKHLAKLLNVSIASLKTGVQVSRSQKRFKYVSWHTGHKKWVAKPPGFAMTTSDECGSCFASQEHAARFVVTKLGLSSVQDLRSW